MQLLKKSVCRTCLSETKLESVFSKINSDEATTYSEILIQGSFVQISEGDDMPMNICETCRDHLNQIYLFKKQCEKADFILRMQIEKDVKTDPLELSVVTDNVIRSQCAAKNVLRDVENSEANFSDDFEDTGIQQIKNINTYVRQKMTVDSIKNKLDLKRSKVTAFSNDCKNDYTDLASDLFTNKVPLTRLDNVTVTNVHSLHKQSSSILVNCRMCKKNYISGSFSQHWAENHESSGVKNTQTNLVIAKSSRKENLPLSSNNQLPSSVENGDSNVFIEKINDDLKTNDYIQTSEGVICLKCNKFLGSYNAFEKHLFVDHAHIKHNCSECSMNFIFREAFLQHRREVHNEEMNEKEQNFTSESPPTEVDTKPFQNRETIKQESYEAESNESFRLSNDSNNDETKDIHISDYNQKPDDIQEINYAKEVKTVTPTKNWIKCLKCKQLSRSVGAFKIHLFITHNEMTFKCDKCARGFVFNKSLRRHKKSGMCKGTVKEQTTVKVPECTVNNRNEEDQGTVKILECTADDRDEKELNTDVDPLLIEVDTVDEKPLQNEEMDFLGNDNTSSDITGTNEVTNGSDEMTNESIKVTNESIEVTNESNKETKDVKTFENIETHTSITCSQCNELLHSKSEYEKHLYIKHGTRLYKCKECNLDFLSTVSSLQHMHEKHGELRAKHYELYLNMLSEKKKICDKCGIEYVHKHSNCICCKNCNMYFKKKEILCRHLIKVHKEKINPCGTCGRSFSNIHRLNKHLKVHKKREIVCKVCGQTFAGTAELDQHLIKTNERAYKCKICDKGFNTLRSLSTHCKNHYESKTDHVKFVCEFCGEQYICKKALKNHIATLHFGENNNITYDESINLYMCNICKRGFATEIIAKVHLRRHTLLNKCKECGEKFGTRQDLLSHEISQHDRKFYKCDKCDRRFRRLGDLTKHALNHDGKTHKCNICKHTFSSIESLGNHRRTHENVKQHRCHFCQRRFLVGANLSTHIQKCHVSENVTGTKRSRCFIKEQYECQACNKQFKYKTPWTIHMNRHADIKPYECQICHKRFASQTHLNLHDRTHTGIKPYKCDHCDKTFTQHSHLRTHKELHSGVKRHVCKYCKKRFTLQQYLRAHIRIHTGETFQCPFCERTFHHCSNLRKHKLSHKNSLKNVID